MEEPKASSMDALRAAGNNDAVALRNAPLPKAAVEPREKKQEMPPFMQPQQEDERFDALRRKIDTRLPDTVVREIMKKYGDAEVSDAFVQMINSAAKTIFENAGESSESSEVYSAEKSRKSLTRLFYDNPSLTKLLINMPDEMAELAQCAGSGTKSMFKNFLAHPSYARLFEKHSQFYIDIAKEADGETERAFKELSGSGFSNRVVPFKDYLVRIAAATGTDAWKAFWAIYEDLSSKNVGATDKSAFYLFEKNPEEFAKAADLYGKDAPLYFKLASAYGIVPTSPMLKERAEVFMELGIEYAERYDKEILENVYLTATGHAQMDGKKLAFIVITKNDPDSYYCGGEAFYHMLLDKGYNLIIGEAHGEDEVTERRFNYGRLEKDSGKNSHFRQGEDDHMTYDFEAYGAHSDQTLMNYEQDFSDEKSNIDFSDYNEMKAKGDWEGMASKGSTVLLLACSTGSEKIPKQGEFQNIMSMMGALINRVTFAPKIDSYYPEDIVFSQNGFVEDVVYTEGDIVNKYVPKGK